MEGNYKKAIDTLDAVIKRVKDNVYIKSVTIDLSCYNGGITNISINSSEPALCSYSPSDKTTDDPDLARITFIEMLQELSNSRHSGEVAFILCCCDGRIFNSRKQQQFNDLFKNTRASRVVCG